MTSAPGDRAGTNWDVEDEYDGAGKARARIRRTRRRKARGARPRQAGTRAGPSLEGQVVLRTRGKYRVRTPRGEIDCSLRGRLQGVEAPVVGDRVRVRLDEQSGQGALEEVLPRRNEVRRVPEGQETGARTIAANIDLLVIVLAVEPFPPRWVLADRLLAVAEREAFEAMIVVNKMDLLHPSSPGASELERTARIYRELGIEVLCTSALEGTGVGALAGRLGERISLFSGHSGVGKSSLMNVLRPGLDLEVRDVNPQTGKGRHTTTLARLVALPTGGFLVDTPGFREFGLGDVDPADLGRYYPEFRRVIGGCRFPDCLHRQEPGCALRRAVEAGDVSNFRYQNYLQILSGLVERG